ncbi:hypothetical protein DFH09DRAFT_1172172 [Mycena vulgaris]|nr:hypothetical protein DFH09DRAFT_1172172 [Mycena vulgaris]
MARPSSHRAASWRGLRPVPLAPLLSQPPPSTHSVRPLSFSSRRAPAHHSPHCLSPPLPCRPLLQCYIVVPCLPTVLCTPSPPSITSLAIAAPFLHPSASSAFSKAPAGVYLLPPLTPPPSLTSLLHSLPPHRGAPHYVAPIVVHVPTPLLPLPSYPSCSFRAVDRVAPHSVLPFPPALSFPSAFHFSPLHASSAPRPLLLSSVIPSLNNTPRDRTMVLTLLLRHPPPPPRLASHQPRRPSDAPGRTFLLVEKADADRAKKLRVKALPCRARGKGSSSGRDGEGKEIRR